MNEQAFLQTITEKSRELNMNPLLLLAGIEGLYTFKDVQLNAINYEFLDSLILTIFALRIGDQFHSIAEENLLSTNSNIRIAAGVEISEMSNDEIAASRNPYLQSFASILNGRSPIRKYHEKALEVAAFEIKKTQLNFNNESISTIILAICKTDINNDLGLASLFSS
jgi:hypothetical protein